MFSYQDSADTSDYEPEQIYLDRYCPQTPYQRLRSSPVHTDPFYPLPEIKIVDQSINATITNNSTTILLLNSLVRGTGVTNRTGNQVVIRGFFWNLIPSLPDAYTTPPTKPIMRIQLLWDRQPNGSLPAGSDIYVSAGFPYFALNYNNKDRFVILRTWVFPNPLNGTTNFETGSISIDMLSTYLDTPGVGFPVSGALYLTYSVNNTNPTPNPNLYGYLRVYYTDS